MDSHGGYFKSLCYKREKKKGSKLIKSKTKSCLFPSEGDNNPHCDMPQSHIFIMTLRAVIHAFFSTPLESCTKLSCKKVLTPSIIECVREVKRGNTRLVNKMHIVC